MRNESPQARLARVARLAELRAEIAALRDRREREFMRARRLEAAEAIAKRHRLRGSAAAWVLATLAVLVAGIVGGHYAELRVREASALECARASDGTDSSIADCYTSRDLPLPEGI